MCMQRFCLEILEKIQELSVFTADSSAYSGMAHLTKDIVKVGSRFQIWQEQPL